ncbi:YheC/YheD family endospore coat-associated protein [Calidifontibacillus oryziterrae]|uniref:YheC/YheD family endospore coat-associated protein n=1 Tax=Calidifontibacillus oryziterrae TaxID=1191699 RepID=UPI00031A1B4E|nr:YheC/YheD family protein [Calidifontibacillus oryziterrae]
MLSFGFLTLNKNIERKYYTEVAKRALTTTTEVFCFSPADIDPNTELVNGEIFNSINCNWERASFPIPNYLYDRCFYATEEQFRKYSPIVNWLKKRRNTTFIGYGLPNKWEIYKILSEHPILNYYVPHSIIATEPSHILKFLKKYQKVLLKPINGSQGKGIVALSLKEGRKIELQTHINKQIIRKDYSNKLLLSNWLKKLITTHSYLVQPLLNLQDHDHQCFDIRVLVQKNKPDQWIEIGRGIRKGQPGFLISNLHSGGTVHSFKKWLKTYNHHERVLIKDDIKTIVSHLPTILEQNFGPLFEIGIDIGVAKDRTIWILDTNSKPGHQTILHLNEKIEDFLYKAPLAYCQHLELQRS